MAAKVGLAVFGLGNMGCVHAQNILTSTRASLRWIVRNNKKKAEDFLKAREATASCTTPTDIRPVLEDPSVAGVVICTPSNTHEELIRLSLQAGKAVLCEKPITVDVDSTRACYELAERLRLPLLCAFHRRFDPSFRSMFEKLQSGNVGAVRMVRTSSRDFTSPSTDYIKTSGGIFFDTVVHDLDITAWMVGSRPVRVFSEGHAFSPRFAECDDIDLQVTSVQFENGVIAIMDNLRESVYGYDQRFEAVCEKGMLKVENLPTTLLTEHGSDVTASPRISQSYLTRYTEAYSAELNHFIDVIQGKSEILITKEQTLQTMRLADACRESFRSGQPVDV